MLLHTLQPFSTRDGKLMGPLEATNGVLMFGMTSAALMAILQRLIKVRFEAERQ